MHNQPEPRRVLGYEPAAPKPTGASGMSAMGVLLALVCVLVLTVGLINYAGTADPSGISVLRACVRMAAALATLGGILAGLDLLRGRRSRLVWGALVANACILLAIVVGVLAW